MKSLNHNKIKKTKGFTLIEMLVAVFVFSIVMTISVGAIFSIVSANKTSQALKSALDNLSSALDTMSRDIRYGTAYNPIGNSTFSFIDKDGNHIIYAFNPTSITNGGDSIYKCTDYISDNTCSLLTAPEVHITNMNFYVTGAGSSGYTQPSVLMNISGTAKAGANPESFNVETMVSERGLICKDSVHISLGLSPCPIK